MTGLMLALRIARRDAWRHRGRSLLVMALIALPVLAGVAIDVLTRSADVTPAQQAQAELADADAWVSAPAGVSGNYTQTWIWGRQPSVIGSAQVVRDGQETSISVDDFPARPAAEVLALLPEGSRITPWRRAEFVPVTAGPASGGRYLPATVDLLDISDPAAGDRYTVLAGHAPAAPNQAAITAHLAAELDVTVGDDVRAGAPQRDYVVSAIVQTAATGNALISAGEFDAVTVLPGQLDFVDLPWSQAGGPRYLVVSPEPITLPMIAALNAHGVGALSAAVLTDPAARAHLDPSGASPLLIAGAVVGAAMAVMQVVFLAGPAFAIGARRMRRQMGQLVATGAQPRHLRMMVLGAAGSLVGLAAGIGAGAALRVALRAWFGYKSAGLTIVPAEVLGIAALGVITAVLAALIPALTASRVSPLALLGRQPPQVTRVRWFSLLGAVAAIAGFGVTVWMAARTLPDGAVASVVASRARGLAIGAVLLEVGLLLAVPLIVHLVAKLGRSLPTVGRLALRDADRHRGRTAPAIAAVTVCATAAVVLAVLITSAGKNAESRYVAGIPVGDVQVQFGLDAVWDLSAGDSVAGGPADQGGHGPGGDAVPDLFAVADAASSAQWPGARTVAYSVVDDQDPYGGSRALYVPDENLCPYGEVADRETTWLLPDGVLTSPDYTSPAPTPAQAEKAATDWRCFGRSYSTLTAADAGVHHVPGMSGEVYQTRLPTVAVGGPELRRAVTGVPDLAADAALAAGGAVALSRALLSPDGTVKSAVLAGQPDLRITDIRSVPAVAAVRSDAPLGVIVSPQAAAELGWSPTPGGLIVDPATAATREQAAQVALAVQAATGNYAQATIEPGRLVDPGDGTRQPLTMLLVVIALLAAGTVIVVTALGLADAKPDLATLAAIGAPPRIRRLITGWTAATVTFLGCALGGAVGLVPAWGLLRLMQTIQRAFADPILVPWSAIGVALVAVPLAAFLIGALLPRSRLPMVARTE